MSAVRAAVALVEASGEELRAAARGRALAILRGAGVKESPALVALVDYAIDLVIGEVEARRVAEEQRLAPLRAAMHEMLGRAERVSEAFRGVGGGGGGGAVPRLDIDIERMD